MGNCINKLPRGKAASSKVAPEPLVPLCSTIYGCSTVHGRAIANLATSAFTTEESANVHTSQNSLAAFLILPPRVLGPPGYILTKPDVASGITPVPKSIKIDGCNTNNPIPSSITSHNQDESPDVSADTEYKKTIITVKLLQALVRNKQSSARLTKQRNAVATICVQTVMEVVLTRRHVLAMETSAIRIETQARVMLARRRSKARALALTIVKGAIKSALARQHESTCLLQSVLSVQKTARGFFVRRLLARQQRAAVVVQAWARQLSTSAVFNESLVAAVKLQSFGRQVLARRVADKRLYSVMDVQKTARGLLLRRSLAQQQRAAVMIQAWGRQLSASAVLGESLAAVIKLQAFGRRVVARRADHRLARVLVIQKTARGFLARRLIARQKHLAHQHSAAVVVQSWLRMAMASSTLRQRLVEVTRASPPPRPHHHRHIEQAKVRVLSRHLDTFFIQLSFYSL
jgi:hypothetical protein